MKTDLIIKQQVYASIAYVIKDDTTIGTFRISEVACVVFTDGYTTFTDGYTTVTFKGASQVLTIPGNFVAEIAKELC